MRSALAEAGFASDAVQYGVDLHQLLYSTVDANGRATQATALVALPRRAKRLLTLVSYAHGTELTRSAAPSTSDDGWGTAPALTFAGAGYVAALPDYPGQGDGPGLHPWMHVPSEVTASHDLLRAVRSFVWQHGRVLARPVLVSGFSQGAFAALGLARALEAGADPWFKLAALAPISAPYQFHGWVESALSGQVEPRAATVYLAYLSVAWQRRLPLYGAPSAFFLAPYADFVEGLFDGSHPGDEVVARLPETPDQLLTREAMATLRTPTGSLAQAFAETELCGSFRTRAPLLLLAASGDREVPIQHSAACRDAFAQRGVASELRDLGDLDHVGSNRSGVAQVLTLFRQLH